jgi:E3 ubiquitin-protein ligase ATL7/58/59
VNLFFVPSFSPSLLSDIACFASDHPIVTRCSVCLADYQPDERLQRIPPCGHTFHIDCIDHWLSTNTTCPLCRVSLLPAPKIIDLDLEAQTAEESLIVQHQEGVAENTQQEDQAAQPGGTGDSHGEEPINESEPVVVTEVAEPQADTEGSPSTTCRPSKMKK